MRTPALSLEAVAVSRCLPSEPDGAGAGATLDVRLRKRYTGRRASSFELEMEFRAQPGVTVLLGPSGAGKTTLLRCIAGLCDPEHGFIAVGQRILFDRARRIAVGPAQRKIGYVFQDLALFPHLTVQENIAYGLRLLDPEARERRTNTILESFQIAHLRKRLPRETSGGEQQRVALARALVTEPSVLLLDEPLSSLDSRTKDGIITDLRNWNEAHRIPILYVTHNHAEVSTLGSRVLILERGRIAMEGSLSDLMPAPPRDTPAQPPTHPPTQPADFENLFDATVTGVREDDGTPICRLAGTSLELRTGLAPVAVDTQVRVGVRSAEILLASAPPEMIGDCNVIRGRVTQCDRNGAGLEVRVDCGAEFRVRLSLGSLEIAGLQRAEVWLIVKTGSCHVLRKTALAAAHAWTG